MELINLLFQGKKKLHYYTSAKPRGSDKNKTCLQSEARMALFKFEVCSEFITFTLTKAELSIYFANRTI